MILIAAGLVVVVAALWAFTAIGALVIDARFPIVGDRVVAAPGAPAIHLVERAPSAPERGAVLLVHGASGNLADMDVALSSRLTAQGFRVFAVDRPGHGWSERLPGETASSPGAQAAALRAALAARGASQAIVVVHSLAGVLGLAMALDAPEFVRGLVLVSPVSHPWPGGVAAYYHVAVSRFFGPAFRYLLVMPAGFIRMRSGVREVFSPNPIPAHYVVATFSRQRRRRRRHQRARCGLVAALSDDPGADGDRQRR
jgi:pimeloyl-ACP methyl ester carboxylesterase